MRRVKVRGLQQPDRGQRLRLQLWRSWGDGPHMYVKLPNEANLPGCCTLWISLMDNVLAVRVRRFGTWLRLSELASFCGVVGA